MARQTEAERLREHRLIFERAIAEGVSMKEARARILHDRWAQIEARLAARRGSRVLCGTPAPAFVAADDSDDRLMWWQR